MPELPEVEVVRRGLHRRLRGRFIVGVTVLDAKPLRGVSAADFARQVVGSEVGPCRRRAKILVIRLSGGKVVLVHLKMTGALLYVPSGEPRSKHTRVIFRLDDDHDLRFVDVRRFGYVVCLTEHEAEVRFQELRLGPEPLGAGFTYEAFRSGLHRRGRRQVKALLLDQSFVAGIGNLYADEVLHRARVRPTRRAGELNEQECRAIFDGMRAILRKAIQEGGTTIANYVDLFGKKGGYKRHLKVYGREGARCGCGAGSVRRAKVAGRSAFYCENCQL